MSPFRSGRQRLGWRSLLVDARLFVAILRHPELWYIASKTAIGLIPRAWWRRPPFLPVPDARWIGFRLETAYGSERTIPSEADFLDFLRWCQMMRRIA